MRIQLMSGIKIRLSTMKSNGRQKKINRKFTRPEAKRNKMRPPQRKYTTRDHEDSLSRIQIWITLDATTSSIIITVTGYPSSYEGTRPHIVAIVSCSKVFAKDKNFSQPSILILWPQDEVKLYAVRLLVF